MIKRGSLYKIPFVSYIINFNNRNYIPDIIFPILNDDNFMSIGFFENENFYKINGKFTQNNLTCTFKKKGFYVIIFSQNSDFCYSFQNDKNNLNFCQNIFSQSINVLKNKDEKSFFYLFFFGLIFLFSFLIFICFIKKFRKEEYDLKNKEYMKYLHNIYLQTKNKNKNSKGEQELFIDSNNEITISIGTNYTENEKLKGKNEKI